ncbi:MAG: CPBP family glutamic-type intramembrane protease [Terrimicrobiaceae bacterium]|nr:CPBP family glutamic-type intramembrane protease [Terrimicrobiaceae bacterium]
MSAWKKMLVVGVGVVLAACLLSPPAYWLLHGHPDLPAWLTAHPFHRYFSRILQVGAVLGGLALVLWLGVRRPADLGLSGGRCWWKDALSGLGFALVPGLLMAAALLHFGVFKVRRDLDPEAWLRIAATAGGVSVVEELLFRGLLLGLMLRAMRPWAAAGVVSAIFAVAHFLRPARTVVGEVTWLSGFQQALTVFHAWPPWPLWAWGLATLFAAGCLLAWTVLRTRALWLAIGLHAGWILAQQGFNWLAKPAERGADHILPWLGPRLVSGVVPTGLWPLAALGLAAVLAAFYLRRTGRA